MTELSLTQQFEQLFEPAARAARQGDPEQIREVLESVRAIWGRFRKRKKGDAVGAAEELARGMTFAIEGILGIVLASAGADARHAQLKGRKHALPILHALGKKARAGANDPAAPDESLRMGELAKAVGALPQNLGELIDAMRDCGLVTTTHQGSARRVRISDIGVQLLEAAKPGWQLTNVDQDLMNERIEESFGRAMEQFETMDQGAAVAAKSKFMEAYLRQEELLVKGNVTFTSRKERATRYTRIGTVRYAGLDGTSRSSGASDGGRPRELRRLTRLGAMTRSLKPDAP